MKSAVSAALHPSTPKASALRTMALACALVCALTPSTAVSQTPGGSGQSQSNTQLPEAPQPSQDREDRATPPATAPPEPATTAPPRSEASQPQPTPGSGSSRIPEQSSSSEEARGDISPPKEDELAHPDAGGAHEWNPLRAMKDVEVGDYYYKAGNYKAAISRFREALEFKPRDAVATFKLAQALEKDGELAEARANYEAYLTILSNGPSAGEARKALGRLSKK